MEKAAFLTAGSRIHCFSSVLNEDKLKEDNGVDSCKAATDNLQKERWSLLPAMIWTHIAATQRNILIMDVYRVLKQRGQTSKLSFIIPFYKLLKNVFEQELKTTHPLKYHDQLLTSYIHPSPALSSKWTH